MLKIQTYLIQALRRACKISALSRYTIFRRTLTHNHPPSTFRKSTGIKRTQEDILLVQVGRQLCDADRSDLARCCSGTDHPLQEANSIS